MKKVFIVKVTNFETQIIVKKLKEKEEKGEIVLFVVKRGENTLSDEIKRKLMRGYAGGSQRICVNYEPTQEEEEALCLKDRISLFDDDDERFSLLERVWFFVSNEELAAFQRLVVAGSRGYIPAMLDAGDFYYSNEKEAKKQIKNVLRGECISRGVSRQALLEAELAVKNKKIFNLYDGGTLTVVKYSYDDIGPVMDLLWNSYEDLIIKNEKTGAETVFTPRKEMEEDLRLRYCYDSTWTTKRLSSSKWKVFCKEGGALKAYECLTKKRK